MRPPTTEEWKTMQARAAARVFELQNELAREYEHLSRCDRALAALDVVASTQFSSMSGGALDKFAADYLPKVRTCNLHTDCDAADVKALARDSKRAAHCLDEDCEDCFGK